MRKVLIALALGAVAYSWVMHVGPFAEHSASGPAASRDAGASAPLSSPAAPDSPSAHPAVERAAEDALARAYEQRLRNVQVEGSGVVAKVLKDDNDGSRHQRFIVRLASGQTILFAHNIDLAARVESLREGGVIEFSGEYVWNDKGGLVHWTHRDPSGRHTAGWLRYGGQLYQ
jgi:hypothetical protein